MRALLTGCSKSQRIPERMQRNEITEPEKLYDESSDPNTQAAGTSCHGDSGPIFFVPGGGAREGGEFYKLHYCIQEIHGNFEEDTKHHISPGRGAMTHCDGTLGVGISEKQDGQNLRSRGDNTVQSSW